MTEAVTSLASNLSKVEAQLDELLGHTTTLVEHRITTAPKDIEALVARVDALSIKLAEHIKKATEALTT